MQSLLEHIPNTRRPDPDVHFHKIRAGQTKERDTGFTGDSFGQHGFSGSGRTDEQHTAGNSSTERLILLRSPEELHDFLQFLDGFINSCDVVEGDMHVFLRVQTAAAASERHRGTGSADATQHENEGADKHRRHQQHWEHRNPVGLQFRSIEPDSHFIQLVFQFCATDITDADQRNIETPELPSLTRQYIFTRGVLPCEGRLRQRYLIHLIGIQ